MPAWSIPGKYNVLNPRMRCQRVKMSISVWSSMCPICKAPVTFGGGITMEKTGPGAFESARKRLSRTQNSAQRPSICCGSYALAISRAMPAHSPVGYADSGVFCVIFDYTGSKVRSSNGLRDDFSSEPAGNRRELLLAQLVLDERFDVGLQD